ncbi:MAG: tRNA (cytidine(34)-2'-O)-methyltransferase [Campylobacterales bacterium]
MLVEPHIPPNTGNVGRLCLGLDARLHLVEPLGFSLEQKALKRAGLDYWESVEYRVYDSLEHFWSIYPLCSRHFFLTTKSTQPYYEANFLDGDFFYFGREDAGLPRSLITQYAKNAYTIPTKNIRSLNLATAVGIVAYEAYRQIEVSRS